MQHVSNNIVILWPDNDGIQYVVFADDVLNKAVTGSCNPNSYVVLVFGRASRGYWFYITTFMLHDWNKL